MKSRLFTCLALLFVFVGHAEAAKLKARNLAGKIKADIYIAPKELFRVPVPVLADLGGTVTDGLGFVHFTDDIGHLFRIEYMELPPDQVTGALAIGEQDFFNRFLRLFYLPNTVWQVMPESKILAQAFAKEPDGPMQLTWMFLPHGSITMNSRAGKPPERDDSYREIALFMRKNMVYIVSLAPSDPQVGIFDKKTPPEELHVTVEKTTLEFIRKIELAK